MQRNFKGSKKKKKKKRNAWTWWWSWVGPNGLKRVAATRTPIPSLKPSKNTKTPINSVKRSAPTLSEVLHTARFEHTFSHLLTRNQWLRWFLETLTPRELCRFHPKSTLAAAALSASPTLSPQMKLLLLAAAPLLTPGGDPWPPSLARAFSFWSQHHLFLYVFLFQQFFVFLFVFFFPKVDFFFLS